MLPDSLTDTLVLLSRHHAADLQRVADARRHVRGRLFRRTVNT